MVNEELIAESRKEGAAISRVHRDGGKGDGRRDLGIPKKKWDENYERIFQPSNHDGE